MTAEIVADLGDITRDEWLQLRGHGIGGSEAAAVCGENPWDTPYTVWSRKTGRLAPTEENEAMRWGSLLEDTICTEVEQRRGVHIVNRQRLYRHSDYPFMLATVDGEIADTADGEPYGLYEGKCSGYQSVWADGVPDHYQIQVQHNLAVTGHQVGIVAVLLNGNRLEMFDVQRDQKLIDTLIEVEAEFWQRVVDGNPPPVTGADADSKAVRSVFSRVYEDTSVDLPTDAEQLLEQSRKAATEAKRWQTVKAEADNRLLAMLGDHESGYLHGHLAVTAKAQTRTVVDTDALKADGLYDKYSRQSQPTRTVIRKGGWR